MKLRFCIAIIASFLVKTLTGQETLVQAIPGTPVSFQMRLIPAGVFTMGSPESVKNRNQDEGPQREVQVDSFWIGVYEVSYEEFAFFQQRSLDTDSTANAQVPFSADAVSRPTPQYIDYTFGKGKSGFPAVSMTQQAALLYCQWLYQKTGQFYRLPTEAEWEYACKLGNTEKAAKGKLDKYAWFYKNSFEKYHEPGSKEPNEIGLYDMLGNVAEWTLDYYDKDYFQKLEGNSAINPWIAPERRHSRTVKGGSYDSNESDCRCSFRQKSDPRWQARDPQIPKSKWWNTDSPFVGFRLVRPVGHLSPEEIEQFFEKAIRY